MVVMAVSDLPRALTVAVLAVGQVASAGLTPVLLGGPDTGAISDANNSPVTPAGYAFAIWGLIYLACLALAVYQLLPSQRGREVHRRTGWWLAGAFASSALWVPVFNANLLWLAQVLIAVLVVCLAVAAVQLTRSGAADTRAEQLLLRLPSPSTSAGPSWPAWPDSPPRCDGSGCRPRRTG